MRQAVLTLAVAGMVVLAGCSGVVSDPGAEPTPSETASPTPTATATPVPTPTATPTPTPVPDADDDGLSDAREAELGTDPNDPDTDGDGLPDGAEVHSDALPGANPLYKDVFVEVDYMRNYSLPADRLATIEREFATAPVENPNGSDGINLHVIRDEQVPYVDVLNATVYADFVNQRHDYLGQGYHYAVLLNRTRLAAGRPVSDGFGAPGGLGVTGAASDKRVAYVFMHELGHSLGLTSDTFGGIDSRHTAYPSYPSIMNYQAPQGKLSYSDGTASSRDFDDWEHVADQLPEVISTEKLETD